MVGKNNHIRTVKSNLKEHYKAYKAGRRWVYASLASLALGAGLLLGSTTAFADEVATTTQDPAASVTKDAGSAATTQTASTVPLKASTTVADTSNTTAVDSSNKQATDNANESANADVKPSANVKPSDTTTANVGKSADTAAQNTPAMTSDTTATKPVSTPTADATPAASSSEEQLSASSKTLVNPTKEQLNAAKKSAEQVYDATHQAQEIDAVAGDPGQTADATLTVSVPAVGYNSGAKDSFTVTFKAAANAGDTYVINLPADSGVFGYKSVQPLAAAAGTTKVAQNADGTRTITDVFTTTTPTTQVITFSLNNNYLGQGTLNDVGKTVTKTITWSENTVAQTPVTFTQTITPTVNLSPVVQTFPNVQKVPAVLPDKNYMFSIKVNEPNGVLDNGYPSTRINKVDNYGGTTITIPVPTGFKLDVDETNASNAFSDGQTITQPNGPGTDLVITAPAGTGYQNYQNGQNDGKGYTFIGSFDITQPATDTVLTATSPVTFNQVMNSDNDTLKATGDPWSVKILGVNTGGSAVGNSTTPDAKASNTSLLLDDDPTDDPAYLSAYGLTYDSPSDTTGAQIKITIPDGLDATSVQVPDSGITPSLYMPGTTSYAYTLTLADGSTETGTVNAGGKITPSSASSIRTIVLTPNTLAPGANFKASGANPTSLFVNGALSHTYDNGDPVQTGDQLTSTITVSYADPTDPGTTISKSASIKQTVVEAVALGMGYKDQKSTMPGYTGDSNDLRAQGGNYGQSSTKIFEPTYYFVIPTATTIKSITGWPQAKISTFKADDGRTVAKVDYSGTGVTINTNIGDPGQNAKVNLTNNADALPGKYPYLMYIVSPTSKLGNTTKVVDTSYTEGNPNALLMQGGSGDWDIVTASSFFNTTFAKGNTDTDPVLNGTSDDQGDSVLTFYDNVVYTSLDEDAKDSKASVAINLPTASDSKNYTFKMTGPAVVPTNYTTVNGDGTGSAINPTVLYSTQPQAVTTATTPNLTGYVTADQVTDWSTIRSIVIQLSDIQANTSTGRIEIPGTTDNFNQQAGKTATLQTIFYGNGAKASVNPKGDASIAITGTSTIKTRFHYVDASGADQYVYLDDLSKTLNDNKDAFNNDYPTKLADFSGDDQALIPTGYKLVTDASGKATPTIIDGSGYGKAEFGQVAQYYYDGDFVQYELVGETSTQVKLVDDNNGGAVVGTPKNISGAPGATANWTMPTIPAGYQLVAGQATSGTYTFAADNNQPVLIHVTHILDHSTKTTTRTITYVVDDPNYTNQVPETQTQKITWKITSDEATGTSFATPTGIYSEQTAPKIEGYTPDKTQIAQEVFNGMATSGIPDDEPVTVTYHADKQQATVEYVDDGNNGAVVGTPTTINGTTSGSANWTADNIPAKYILAKGQAASGTYQFTNGTDQVVKIHLTHVMDYSTATTTRTITYVVDDPNYTGQVPETQIQKLNWNVVKDTVTGATVATPVGIYSAQTAPTIDGYTANPTTISKEVFNGVTTLPQNEKVEVHYTANDQQVTVEYVDDDNAGAVVGTPTTLTGKTSGTANWNTDNLPAGYQLAQGQAASGTYQFNNTNNRTVKIHLNHVVDYSTQKTNRTITYTVDDSNYTGQVPETQTQTITWKITTDEATGTSFATPTGIYSEQTVPAIDGYTPNQDKVEQVTYNGMDASGIPGDDTVKIIYHANAQKVIVEYVDDSNNGVVVGTPETVSGQTSGTVDWNTDSLPTGYKLAKGQAASGTYQFTYGTNQTIKIHLSHVIDYTTVTTTRTINYVVNDASYPGQEPETQTQTITWDVATDEVTHASVAVPQGGYAAQTIPTIPGYTAIIDNVAGTTVAGKNYGGVATSQMPKSETVTVTYTPNAQTVTVEYVDDAKGGAVVGNPTTINGKTSGTATWNTDNIPAGYKLAKGQAASGTYQFTYGTNQTIKIHLSHIIDNTTATTTRTINYVVNDASYPGQTPETQTQTITWNVATDEVTHASVAVPKGGYAAQTIPTIPGYTATIDNDAGTLIAAKNYGGVATSQMPKNETVTVTYTSNAQTVTVEYVDDAKGGAVVGNPTTINGKTFGTATWNTDNMPVGYKLAKGQAASGTYQFTYGTNQTIKIHLSHIIDNTTATTTRTIIYVVDDANYTGQVPETQTQTITWNIATDEVTGASEAVPQSGYAKQDVPTINGYTADPTAVQTLNYGAVLKDNLPAPEKITVTYTPNKASATVEYVDDAKGGAIVGTPTIISGKTSGAATWDTTNLPAGYKLAKGQAASGTYQFTNNSDQTIKIHLNHVIDNTTATTTRTITYVVDDPNYTGQVPAAKTQTITWNVTMDEVNGASVAVPQSGYSSQNAPEIPGYTPDSATVQAQNYGAAIKGKLPDSETVTVIYTPNAQSAQVEYVDDANGGAVVGNPTTITGKTSGTATWNTDNIPTGYKLAKGQATSGTYQFTNDGNQAVQIHLSHIIDNTTATTTRTITYVVDDPNYTGQVPAVKTQTITWNVTTDEVNGHMVAIPQSGYAEETAPTLDGYTADPLSVAQQSYAGVTSLPDNETSTVTYTPNNQTVTLEYVDDDNDGAVVGTPTTLSGKTSGKVDWNTDNKPTGYSLAAGQAGSGTYQFTAGSDQLIQVHLNHVIEYTTTKTTRTVHFVVDDPNYTGQTPAPMVQTVIWNVATDKATGVSVATPQTGYYEETVPSLSGYTASQTKVGQQALGSVAASDVPMYNEDVVVTYTPDVQTTPSDGEGVPGEPTEPTGPTTPEGPTGTGSITGEIVPETPAPGEAISTTPEKGEKGSATSGNTGTSGTTDENTGYAGTTQDVNSAAATVSSSQSKTSAASQGKLPQTNEQSHSEVGLGLLGLLTSMLGLVGLKRRKRDDE